MDELSQKDIYLKRKVLSFFESIRFIEGVVPFNVAEEN